MDLDLILLHAFQYCDPIPASIIEITIVVQTMVSTVANTRSAHA